MAGMVLCFRFVTKPVLVVHWWFTCCCPLLVQHQSLAVLLPAPLAASGRGARRELGEDPKSPKGSFRTSGIVLSKNNQGEEGGRGEIRSYDLHLPKQPPHVEKLCPPGNAKHLRADRK